MSPTKGGKHQPSCAISGLMVLMLCLSFPMTAVSSDFPHDQLGRSVELDYPAQRIVTIPMPAAAVLMGLQQGPGALVGMHPESHAAVKAGVLGKLFPQALAMPTNVVGRGFMPNVEAVLATAPDLVIQWGQRGSDLIAPLEAAGLTVAAVRYGTEDDVRGWLSLFGAYTGHQAQADYLINVRKETLARLAPLRTLPSNDKPKVLYLARVLSGLQVAGEGTFNVFSIRAAGGRNAADSINGVKPVNREQVLAWNPDIILLNNFEPGLTPQNIIEDPILGLTVASQQQRVYNIPIGGYRWDPPSHESPLSWLWLAQRLHPDKLDIDLRKETKAFFTKVYGKPIDSLLISRVLGEPGRGVTMP